MRAFAAGDRVRVIAAYPPGHVRTPAYVRGKCGVVAAVVGSFENPEELAYARRGRMAPLYRVRFVVGELFAGAVTPNDEVDVEIFEHWLEAA